MPELTKFVPKPFRPTREEMVVTLTAIECVSLSNEASDSDEVYAMVGAVWLPLPFATGRIPRPVETWYEVDPFDRVPVMEEVYRGPVQELGLAMYVGEDDSSNSARGSWGPHKDKGPTVPFAAAFDGALAMGREVAAMTGSVRRGLEACGPYINTNLFPGDDLVGAEFFILTVEMARRVARSRFFLDSGHRYAVSVTLSDDPREGSYTLFLDVQIRQVQLFPRSRAKAQPVYAGVHVSARSGGATAT